MRRFLNRVVRFWLPGLFLACLLSGCTPQQRLTRLVNRHPCLVSDTLLHFSTRVITPPISASFSVPARPDTTFETTDSPSGVTVRVCLTDSTVNVEIDKPADTLSIDTCLVVPRYKLEAPADKVTRRRQIIFAVSFCFGCVTLWFLSSLMLKIFK